MAWELFLAVLGAGRLASALFQIIDWVERR